MKTLRVQLACSCRGLHSSDRAMCDCWDLQEHNRTPEAMRAAMEERLLGIEADINRQSVQRATFNPEETHGQPCARLVTKAGPAADSSGSAVYGLVSCARDPRSVFGDWIPTDVTEGRDSVKFCTSAVLTVWAMEHAKCHSLSLCSCTRVSAAASMEQTSLAF